VAGIAICWHGVYLFLKLMEKATIKMSVIANATLKFLISLPITKPITMAATNNNWLLVGLNMKGECDNLMM